MGIPYSIVANMYIRDPCTAPPEDIETFWRDVQLRFKDCRNVAENDAETVQPAGLPRFAASDRSVKV